MNRARVVWLGTLGSLIAHAAFPAPVAIDLGAADGFAVLAGTTVTNTGTTTISGDVGVFPGSSLTGFVPSTIATGVIHDADAVATQASAALTAAYGTAAAATGAIALTGQDLGGKTLTPGIYAFADSAGLTGTLTLDAQGDPNA